MLTQGPRREHRHRLPMKRVDLAHRFTEPPYQDRRGDDQRGGQRTGDAQAPDPISPQEEDHEQRGEEYKGGRHRVNRGRDQRQHAEEDHPGALKILRRVRAGHRCSPTRPPAPGARHSRVEPPRRPLPHRRRGRPARPRGSRRATAGRDAAPSREGRRARTEPAPPEPPAISISPERRRAPRRERARPRRSPCADRCDRPRPAARVPGEGRTPRCRGSRSRWPRDRARRCLDPRAPRRGRPGARPRAAPTGTAAEAQRGGVSSASRRHANTSEANATAKTPKR